MWGGKNAIHDISLDISALTLKIGSERWYRMLYETTGGVFVVSSCIFSLASVAGSRGSVSRACHVFAITLWWPPVIELHAKPKRPVSVPRVAQILVWCARHRLPSSP